AVISRAVKILQVNDSGECEVIAENLQFVQEQLRSSGAELVSIISVMGSYRTGKSFLLDLLLRRLRAEEAQRRAEEAQKARQAAHDGDTPEVAGNAPEGNEMPEVAPPQRRPPATTRTPPRAAPWHPRDSRPSPRGASRRDLAGSLMVPAPRTCPSGSRRATRRGSRRAPSAGPRRTRASPGGLGSRGAPRASGCGASLLSSRTRATPPGRSGFC
ncbi:unnamed protein product, partial [Prorocentrum cordatum]